MAHTDSYYDEVLTVATGLAYYAQLFDNQNTSLGLKTLTFGAIEDTTSGRKVSTTTELTWNVPAGTTISYVKFLDSGYTEIGTESTTQYLFSDAGLYTLSIFTFNAGS